VQTDAWRSLEEVEEENGEGGWRGGGVEIRGGMLEKLE
jgi:hypothetical protein